MPFTGFILLARARDRDLRRVDLLIREDCAALVTKAELGQEVAELSQRLLALTAYESRLLQARTWPYDTAMLRTVFVSVLVPGGTVLDFGTHIFALASGSTPLTNGYKWCLGTYDFIVASNITWNPQYDNLLYLLTNTYGLTYGVDFQYGVVNLGPGLYALELSSHPEPSTVLLLGLGGLLAGRRLARPRRRSAATALPALVCG